MKVLLLKAKKVVVENWPVVAGALALVVLVNYCGPC
jgi:hypothetical protein|tara:strand:+ start:141 stop:248 length:108 start_codon:yes stop_codon:yes gene_type:complete